MARIEVQAYAKLNLTLDVLGKREDGYHDLRMVMQTVSLSDRIRLETGTGQGVQVRSNLGFLPSGEKNLAAAAAICFLKANGLDCGGLSIELEKAIPVCAGLAGGSADAAAVLRGMDRLLDTKLRPEELERLGERLGSDVPYCVQGGTALAEGRGERLTPLPALPPCHVVLCKPGWSVSTPELFHHIDGVRLRRRPDTAGLMAALEAGDLPEIARRLYNVFEDVLPPRRAGEIAHIKNTLIQRGALGACMSGTGPTVFGVFNEGEAARQAFGELVGVYQDVFLTGVVERAI